MADSLLEQVKADSPSKVSRRNFLRRATWGAGFAALGLAGYSGLVEPNEVVVRKLEMRVRQLSPAFDNFKIALLSDFHFGPFTGAHEIGAAVRAANELHPDVMMLLGDFVSEPVSGDPRVGANKAEPCADVLSGLRSRLGSLAVLGNHDFSTDPDFVTDSLEARGIRVLRNANRVLEQNGGRLWILGVDDATTPSAADLGKALSGVPASEPKVLLGHAPDYADYSSRYGIDVQFSGHSHGGQIRIPGIHPLWLPDLAHKYYRGYYRVGPLQLYTNEGIGTIGLPFRFCSPPEVTLVTLRAA
jgi:hypothetical protein